MIEFVSGDLFAAPDLPALAHGCNCAGAMGAGIAVDFKRRWPAMYDEYHRLCKAGAFKPGDVFTWEARDRTIFNLGTQKTWRTKATLGAIQLSVSRMVALADERGLERIGVPRIGAGHGRLEWPAVKKILEQTCRRARVNVVVFESYVKVKS
jgi:O-acetyl-ADP-ribose deacetylase (regulator of RNase III)